MNSHILTHWVQVAGGACFVWFAFVSGPRRNRAHWARLLLALTGVITVALGATQLLGDYRWLVFGPRMTVIAQGTFHLIRGLILGFIFSLILSGQLLGTKSVSTSGCHDSAAS
jgi:hypothetical protein